MKTTTFLSSALVAIISYGVMAQDLTRLTAADARARLAANGIGVNKPEPDTSLQGVMANTINEAINLRHSCHCDLVVTGGTERGHSSAHSQGYKLDYRLNAGLGNYIKSHYEQISNLGNWQRYKDPKGNIFMEEIRSGGGSHWDVHYIPKAHNETV